MDTQKPETPSVGSTTTSSVNARIGVPGLSAEVKNVAEKVCGYFGDKAREIGRSIDEVRRVVKKAGRREFDGRHVLSPSVAKRSVATEHPQG